MRIAYTTAHRVMISRVGTIICALIAILVTSRPSHAQPVQRAPRTVALDIAVGMANTRGPEIAKSDAFVLDLTMLRMAKRFTRIGGGMGIRTGAGNGDVCVMAPPDYTRCLPNLKGHLELVGLGGIGISDDSGELRLLAGPLLVVGEGTPGFGGVLAADGAVGVQAFALTFGVRASTAHRSHGGRLTASQGTLGIRFRY